MLRDLLAGIGILFASLFGGASGEPAAVADPIPVHSPGIEIASFAAAPAAAASADQGLAFATTGIPAPVAAPTPPSVGISPAVLTASLAALRSELLTVSATGVSDTFLRLQVDRIYDSIELANRGIDQRITSLSAADITGLDSLPYLPSGGGSLSGSLSLSDTLSVASTTAGHFFTVTLDGTTSLLSVRASTTPGLSSPNHALTISNRSTTDGAWTGILFQTNEGADNRRAQIKAGRDTTASVDGLGSGVGYLAFTTRATGGTSGFAQGFAERLRITGPGKVGIGTTSPTAWLDVVGKSGNTASLQVSPLLQLSTVNPSSAYATTTHLIVTNLGNIGIGTVSPSYRLDVGGDARLSGLLDASYIVASSSTATSTFAGAVIVGSNVLTADPALGRVGIGTAAPSNLLHLETASVGAYTTASGGNLVRIVNTDTTPGAYVGIALQANGNNVGVAQGGINLIQEPSVNASGHLAFYTRHAAATAEKMRITSNGNVGIATTSPWGKLAITNTGTTPSLLIEDAASPDPSPFIVDANGNVGIGTANPTYPLEVSGAARIDNLQIRYAGHGLANAFSIGTSNTISGTAAIAIGVNASAAGSGLAIGETTSAGGSAIALGYHTAATGGSGPIAIGSAAAATGNASIAIGPGASSSAAQTLAIGNPTDPNLAVTHSYLGSSITSSNPQSHTIHASGGSGTDIAGATLTLAGGRPTGAGTGGAIAFQTAQAGSSGSTLRPLTERMRITEAGNVGVATTSPWRRLSVTGTVGFDGLTAATGAGSLCLSASNEVVTNAGSDACLPSVRATKHAIANLDLDALATVLTLEPVSFVYNEGDGRTRYGFIAEDTAAILAPLATYAATTTVSGIDDRAVLAVVVKAIQSLWASLTDRLTDHERRIAELEAELAAFRQGAPAQSRSAEEADASLPAADESSATAPTHDLAHALSTPAPDLSSEPGASRTEEMPTAASDGASEQPLGQRVSESSN